MSSAGGEGQRAVPMFCPYCGEGSLRPFGDDPDKDHAQWACEDCLRVFTVRFRGTTGR